jgi:hypothetical protein
VLTTQHSLAQIRRAAHHRQILSSLANQNPQPVVSQIDPRAAS